MEPRVETRIALNSPLAARPICDGEQRILAFLESRELLVIDSNRFVVIERRMVEGEELKRLGFPDENTRLSTWQDHRERRLDFPGGWEIDKVCELYHLTLYGLKRSLAGREEVGACVVAHGETHPTWIQASGAGSCMYLYGVGDMLVLHNVGLEVEPMMWAYWQATGLPVLRVTGRGPGAMLEIFGERREVVARSEV
jgi:hypothetical protein